MQTKNAANIRVKSNKIDLYMLNLGVYGPNLDQKNGAGCSSFYTFSPLRRTRRVDGVGRFSFFFQQLPQMMSVKLSEIYIF